MCNTNRGVLTPVRGVPWVVLIVLGVLFGWSFLLNRTRFGRDVHAIGSNAEAARRAGVSLAWIRTVSFALAGLTAGMGGIIYASELRSVSSGTDGATLVLYAVAAAVIGGTSLFGGRGKPLDGVLGGLVIAAIYNGIYLLGMSAAAQDLIFALVLLAAVSADVVARRGQCRAAPGLTPGDPRRGWPQGWPPRLAHHGAARFAISCGAMTAPARPAPQAPARPVHRRPVLIALMTAMALAAMDTTIVSTAIPQVVRDLGGFSLFSWVFSSYLLTQTVTIPAAGRLADQWGRKPVLIVGTVVFLAGSALCASSATMVSLILFRGLQGIGAGGVQATVNTLAGDLYDLSERGRVQGWLSSVWGISAVIGPALGGSLAQYASWRWIFLINLPVGAVTIGLLLRYLHENVHRTRHRIDVAGGAAIFVAAGALIFGLLQGGVAWAWWSIPSGLVFAVALAAAVLAAAAERRAAEPILPPWFWRSRVLAGSAAAGFGLGFLVIGPTTFLPTYGQSVLGLGAVAAGGVLAADEHRLAAGHLPVGPAVPARRFPRHPADRRGDLPGRSGGVPARSPAPPGLAASRGDVRARGRAWPALGGLDRGGAVHRELGPARRGDRDRDVLPLSRPEPGRGVLRGDLQRGPEREAARRARRAAPPAARPGQRGRHGAGPAPGPGPGGRGLPARRDRHRHHPRLRRAHGGGRADHRRGVADHAEALQHGRRGERVHRAR